MHSGRFLLCHLPARTLLLLIFGAAAHLCSAPGHDLLAQDAEWNLETEIGGSVYFGNTSQTTVNTRLSTERSDSTYDLATEVTYAYGEAEKSVEEVRRVPLRAPRGQIQGGVTNA